MDGGLAVPTREYGSRSWSWLRPVVIVEKGFEDRNTHECHGSQSNEGVNQGQRRAFQRERDAEEKLGGEDDGGEAER